MHSVTAKLNKDARQHPNQSGMTFFVSLGEKNYDFKTKKAVWTNYDAALFAKDTQVQFYTDALREGSIITVCGKGIIVEDQGGEYAPKLIIQDAKLNFVYTPGVGMPPQVQQQVQQLATQQAPPQAPPQQQAPPPQQAPAQQPAPAAGGFDDFDEDIPF